MNRTLLSELVGLHRRDDGLVSPRERDRDLCVKHLSVDVDGVDGTEFQARVDPQRALLVERVE